MRKLVLLLLAVASLAAAGAGAAADSARTAATATQTVTISRTGYNPTSVSITTGESVLFSNGDSVAHSVGFKSTAGMSCGVAIPFTVQPGQGVTCTFSATGKFNFSDPSNKGKNFRGTVTVSPPLTSAFTATPKSVIYGRKVTLAGTLASKLAGQSLQVLAQACGATSASTLATVTSSTGGAFTYAAQPLKRTAYSVKSKSLTTSVLTVDVKPRLRLGKVSRHHYSLRVFAAQSFAGKVATFQRFRATTKRWVKVRRVTLKASSTGVAPTVISTASFRSSINARQRVRVTLGQKQVGSCYSAGRSNTIRS